MRVSIQEAIDRIGKKHPGPDKRMHDSELLAYRDNLVRWLEEHWPDIVKPLLTVKSPEQTAAVFEAVAEPADIRSTWQKSIIDHPSELREFLASEKFRRKPPKKTVVDAVRLVAPKSAIAQPIAYRHARSPTRWPECRNRKWRTSLDKCATQPSSLNVGHNTARYYRTTLRIAEE